MFLANELDVQSEFESTLQSAKNLHEQTASFDEHNNMKKKINEGPFLKNLKAYEMPISEQELQKTRFMTSKRKVWMLQPTLN